MSTGNKVCETNKCTSCNCSCQKPGGHSCTECTICTQNDNHTRKIISI